jgi:hypothetical protein
MDTRPLAIAVICLGLATILQSFENMGQSQEIKQLKSEVSALESAQFQGVQSDGGRTMPGVAHPAVRVQRAHTPGL